ERLAVQRTDRAQVDDVPRQLVIDAALDPGADLHPFAAARRAEFLDAGNVLPEAHAARAMDAARHVGRDERPDVLVLDDTLAFAEARNVPPATHRAILQLALAALVADRTVERVVDQQEFHRRLLAGGRLRRIGADLHALGDGR